MKVIKKFFSYILSSIICCSLFCMTGCGFDGVRTDEEIYSALANATKELFNYDGELTIKMSTTIEQDYNGDKTTETANFSYSIHPSERKMYCLIDSEDAKCDIKVFTEEGKTYIKVAVKAKETTNNGGTITNEVEEYQQIKPEAAIELLTSISSFQIYTEQDLRTIFTEYLFSFAETKAAFESVYAEQVAERLKFDETAAAEYKISTKRTLSTISLEEYSKIQKTDQYGTRGVGLQTKTQKSELIGKNGKISKVTLENNFSYVRNQQSTGINEFHEKTNVEMDLEYSFDKKGYDGIETELPSYVKTNMPSVVYTKNFNVEGVTIQKTFTSASYNSGVIFNNLKFDFHKSGATIDWYENDSFTKQLQVDSLSHKDFYKLEYVYGKINVSKNYAIVGTNYKIKDERSDAYKAVFGPVFEESFEDEGFESYYLTGENLKTYTIAAKGEEYQTFVNGTQYDSSTNSFRLGSGRFYLVEYVKLIKNADYSIFDY